MKTLVAIRGLYVAIGWVGGLVALFRSRTSPFYMLEDLSPIKSAAAAVAFWPIVLLEEWRLERTRRRLREGPIRTDWVVTNYPVPPVWITEKVASNPKDFDWARTSFTPEENPGVQELLEMMRPGDELWKFDSGQESWRRMSGRSGFVLVRDGRQYAHLTLVVN